MDNEPVFFIDAMANSVGLLIGYAGSLAGIFTSVFYFRRAKRAEVHSREIATADQMIELVKKANAEALKITREISEANRLEIEKLRNDITKLENAIKAIPSCPYRANCPVTDALRDHTSA